MDILLVPCAFNSWLGTYREFSGLRTYREYRAEKSAAGLQRLLKITARGCRGFKLGERFPAGREGR